MPYLDKTLLNIRTVVSVVLFISGAAFWTGGFVRGQSGSAEDIKALRTEVESVKTAASKQDTQTSVAIATLAQEIRGFREMTSQRFDGVDARIDRMQMDMSYRRQAKSKRISLRPDDLVSVSWMVEP